MTGRVLHKFAGTAVGHQPLAIVRPFYLFCVVVFPLIDKVSYADRQFVICQDLSLEINTLVNLLPQTVVLQRKISRLTLRCFLLLPFDK